MTTRSEELGHLLASFPDVDAGEGAVDALESFVLSASAQVTGSDTTPKLLSVEEVTRHIYEATGLAFESGEVHAVLLRLEDDKKIRFTDRDKHSFVVSGNALKEVSLRAIEQLALKEMVEEEFIGELLIRRGDLSYEQATWVWVAVDTFVVQMMNSRSAEAASFLYVDSPSARIGFEAALNQSRGLIQVPEDRDLDDIASEALVPYLQDANANRTEYLLSSLNRAFLFHLLSIDGGASRLVKSVVQGKSLYIDTNFLFRLLALHGPRQAYAPAFIVNMAGDLGSTVKVARATVEEFKSTVRHRTTEIRSHWLKREDFQRLAAEYPTTDVDFMGQFYREMQAGLVADPDDFERKYMQVDTALEDWGIDVDETMEWDDGLAASLATRSQQLFTWHKGERSAPSCDHDVLMEHYINRLRTNRLGGLKDVDAWFLTYDRRLTRFAYSTASDGKVPFTLLAGDWLQIVRQFLPRTDDYNAAFLSMVASPLLADDRAVPIRHVVGALDRLQRYEGLTERVVAGMIAEQEFVRRFAEVTSDEEELELVESRVAKVAAVLDERISKLEAQLQRSEFERDKATVTANSLAEGLRKHDSLLEEQSQRIEAQSRKMKTLAKLTRDLETQRDTATGEVQATTADLGAVQVENQALRRGVFGALSALTAAAVYVSWPLIPKNTGRTALLVFSAAILVVGGGWLWDRDGIKKSGFWMALLALIVTVATWFV